MEAAAPYVYDRFIGVWGMFPHHEHVPMYFEKHIYAHFFLGMHPYYTSTPSSFYGAGGGRIHSRPGASKDLGAHLEPYPLVGRPVRTMIRTYDVAESS